MRNILLVLALLWCLFSCAPTKKEVQVSHIPVSTLPSGTKPTKKQYKVSISLSDILPIEEIDSRINILSQFLQNPDLSQNQKDKLKDIINTYASIKDFAVKAYGSQQDVKNLISILFKSFSKIEDEYISEISKKQALVNPSEIVSKIAQERQKIIQAYNNAKYTDVVNRCLELKLKYGGDVLDPDLETIFALSLGKMGMLREAIDTGEKVLVTISSMPDYNFLKQKLVEWRKNLEEAGLPMQEKAQQQVGVSEKIKEKKVDLNLIITNAERLIEQENFEQALSILNESGVTDNQDINNLKDKAIEGIINRDRNKAAKLFLLAKETNDLQKKKEYLNSAYRILEALIIQYPNSPLINRIKENLNKVSEELKNLSPISSETTQ